MEIKLKIFLIILLIISIYLIIRTIKYKKLSIKYGLYWTIIFLFLLIILIFPNIIESISLFLGFKELPNMLFLISIFILFYIVFRLYISISKLQEENRILIQEISILKNQNKK